MLFEKIERFFGRAKEKAKGLQVCDERALHQNAIFAFLAYSIVLFWALWLKFNDFSMVVLNYRWLSEMTVKERFLYDLIPFRIRYDFINQFVQFPANAIAFAPLGVVLNQLFQKKNIWRDLAICVGLSLCIEVVQLFTVIGSFATADLIMNTLGYFVGFAFYRLIFVKLSIQKTVWIYRVVNLILVSTLIGAVITTVNNWDLIVAIITRTL